MILNEQKFNPAEIEESDGDLKQKIKESMNRLNSEISVDDSTKYKYLQLLNEMNSMFEIVYSKNIGLMNLCSLKNDELLRTVNQIAVSLKSSDQSQLYLKELNVEYQNVLSTATKHRDQLNESKEEIQQLKTKIMELRNELNSTKEIPPEDIKKAIAQLNTEIKSLKIQYQRNETIKKGLKGDLLNAQQKFQHEKDIIQAYSEEIENSTELIQEYEESKINMKQTEVDTEKEIGELEVVIKELTEIEQETAQKLENETKSRKFDEFTEFLENFDRKILILQEEQATRFHSIDKLSKVLEKLQKEIITKEERHSKISQEVEQFDSILTSCQDTLNKLNLERKEIVPEYVETMNKFNSLQKEKNEFRTKSKDLNSQLMSQLFLYVKQDNNKNSTSRKVSQATNDHRVQLSILQKEVNKNKNLAYQIKTADAEAITQKKHLFQDGMHAQNVENQIADKQVEIKFYRSNYQIEQSLYKNNMKSIEELNEKLLSIKKKTAENAQMIETVINEKNKYLKQIEVAKEEHEQLEAKYHEISDQVDKLTQKIDQVINDTISDHFMKLENKNAIGYLEKMKKSTEKAIKETDHLIQNLITEKRTLQKISHQTDLDRLAQQKELHILKASQDKLRTQLSEKVREIDNKKEEILLNTQLLQNRKSAFDAIMKQFYEFEDELKQKQEQTFILQSKIEWVKELKVNKTNLENNLMIQHCKITALYNESKIKYHFHRWNELSAFDTDRLKQIQFSHKLKSDLIEKSEELKQLLIERDQLKEKVKQREEYVDRFFKVKNYEIETPPNDDEEIFDDTFFITKQNKTKSQMLIDEIAKTKEILKEKTNQIEQMKQLIEHQSNSIIQNRQSIDQVKKMVNERRSLCFQLNCEKNDLQSQIEHENEKVKVDPIDLFLEDRRMKAIINVRGGGFKPRPPQSEYNLNAPRSARRRKRGDNEDEIHYNSENENNQTRYVTKKRNGRVLKFIQKNDNEEVLPARSNGDNYAFHGGMNCNSEFSTVYQQRTSQSSRRPDIREFRKKLQRNVSIPETANQKNQNKKKRKFTKKKKKEV